MTTGAARPTPPVVTSSTVTQEGGGDRHVDGHTWNGHNRFPGRHDGPEWHEDYDAEIAALIDRLEHDVPALQEVWGLTREWESLEQEEPLH